MIKHNDSLVPSLICHPAHFESDNQEIIDHVPTPGTLLLMLEDVRRNETLGCTNLTNGLVKHVNRTLYFVLARIE